ncbi:MAG: SurA N-terminal domain-containing protein [Candidatus Omnitrophota bacterium]
MLKFLRKEGVMKKILWVVAVVIIISFGFMGNAYLFNKGPQKLRYAGKVFGKKVSLEEFEENFEYIQVMAYMQYGKNLREKLPSLNLESQTWDRIILLKEAQRRGLRVKDQEVIEAIKEISLFQRNESFDPVLYNMVLRRHFKIPTRSFEEGMRGTLKVQKLFDRETIGLSVSDKEVRDAYTRANAQVRVAYVLFPAEDYLADVPFDEIQAKNYFLEHKEDFRRPRAYKVNYLRFDYGPEADETAKDRQYEEALRAVAALRQSPDVMTLKEYAQQENLTLETSDFLSPDDIDLSKGWSFPVLQKIFQMEKGATSDILETADGYLVLEVADIRPAYHPAYPEVKDAVRDAWKKSAAMEISKRHAQEALQSISSSLSKQTAEAFSAAARDQGLTVRRTPDFTRGQYLQNIGQAPAFQQAAFELTNEEPLSEVTPTPKGYTFMFLEEYLPIDEETFAQQKDEVRQQLLAEKKNTVFQEFIADLRQRAELEDKISEYLKKNL